MDDAAMLTKVPAADDAAELLDRLGVTSMDANLKERRPGDASRQTLRRGADTRPSRL